MDNTELRRVEGTNSYLVSADGKVFKKLKHKPRARQRQDNKIFYLDSYWVQLKPYPCSKGYVRVEIDGKATAIHRLVAQTFIPNPDQKPQVNHLNGVRDDNRVENLEWVTNQENSIHAIEQLGRKPSYGGRNRKGSENKTTKVLYDKIQHLLETTMMTKEEIAQACGCSYPVVKRCHSIRKVQRLSQYDHRKARTSRE
ncbi:HNH endonuclease signature motif containing protein [Aerosakkonemataceae cyanobacterium BLCC-F154]|uniref:HNH endonuclease signature motif containing protein n=1 Tax=Floridaenema fluviatile BLCC-F154 TaxID=3153640 RepID=A0ABV4YHP5_9CYAN